MTNGWNESAGAWIDTMGEHGDFGRRFVLDPVMLSRARNAKPKRAIDVGCGEGRFCRMLQAHGIHTIGIDPASNLIAHAKRCHPQGIYLEAEAERLPFPGDTFELVISYLSLIDIPDIRKAIPEMVRVLQPGGHVLIANLNGFNTAGMNTGWQHNLLGHRKHYAFDNYMDEWAAWCEWRSIRIINHHRPLSTYMSLLLDQGLVLRHFDEPRPIAEAPIDRAKNYIRAPWFCVMEWQKPSSA